MKRLLCILVGLTTFWAGLELGSAAAFGNLSSKLPAETQTVVQPRFLHLRGFGEYADFKSSGSRAEFPKNCPECAETGDIAVDRRRLEASEPRTLDYSRFWKEKDVKCSFTKDAGGRVTGESCRTVGSQKPSWIVWIEGDERWSIRTTSPELAAAFENSPEFAQWRAKAAPLAEKDAVLQNFDEQFASDLRRCFH